jgi:hypothetical protein
MPLSKRKTHFHGGLTEFLIDAKSLDGDEPIRKKCI